VLTEESRFGGTLADLATARAASSCRSSRKDFIVEEYQVHETLAGGADAILLIVAALDTGTLIRLHRWQRSSGCRRSSRFTTRSSSMPHTRSAPDRRINNRDLTTLAVDVERTYQLLPDVQDGPWSSPSQGIRRHAQLAQLTAAGVDAVLVGEALIARARIEAATRVLLGSQA